jgi:hypothetical protein
MDWPTDSYGLSDVDLNDFDYGERESIVVERALGESVSRLAYDLCTGWDIDVILTTELLYFYHA